MRNFQKIWALNQKYGYLETRSERLLNALKEFVSETKLISIEEKKIIDK